MRFKILFIVVACVLASIGFAQDINRAKGWNYKRAERPQAKVMVETKFNGVTSPVGEDPAVLDGQGQPIVRKVEETRGLDSTEAEATDTVRKQSDRLVRNEFEVAGAVVEQPEKEKTSPVLMGSIFLILGLLLAVGFGTAARKIKVPAEL